MSDTILIMVFGFLAAIISGIAGFGGALFLIPVVVYSIGVTEAIPVITIGQVFGNGARVWFGRRELHWKPILCFLITAIPFAFAGSHFFVVADKTLLIRLIGVALILVVIVRRINPGIGQVTNRGLLIGGALAGTLSAVVGTSGPVGPLFFLGLNLTPVAYIASEAVTSLTIHLTKVAVYHSYTLFTGDTIQLGVLLGLAMIGGTWVGKQVATRISRAKFVIFVEAVIVMCAIQMIIIKEYQL